MDKATLAFWKTYNRVTNPLFVPTSDDIGELYVERDDGPSRRLLRDILRQDDATQFKALLCGARGCGKSTELTRLAAEIRPDFVAIALDVGPLLGQSFNTTTLVGTIAGAAEAALRYWRDPRVDLGHAKASVPWEGVAKALEALGVQPDHVGDVVDLGAAVLAWMPSVAPAGAALAAAKPAVMTAARAGAAVLRATGTFLHHASQPQEPTTRDALVGATNAVLDELKREAEASVILLVEGFDKSNADDVLRAFEDVALINALGSAAVFTGPVTLKHDPRFATLRSLRPYVIHNLPVIQRNGARPNEQSLAQLAQMVHRRAAKFGLPEGVLPDAVIREAARLSSGAPLEMFKLLDGATSLALEAGRRHVIAADLEGQVRIRRHELQSSTLRTDYIDVLVDVLASGELPTNADADLLLYEGFIAAYPNGDAWFRPCEILVPWVESKADERKR